MLKQFYDPTSRRKPTQVILPVVLMLLSCSVFAAPPKVTRFKLRNGIRVVVLRVEESEKIGIFSYLPLGLAADGKGKTQWSHLIEHLTLRTTGPINDFRERNAETMQLGMHLDFMGAQNEWQRGLDLQAKWLSGLPFSETALREETPKALAEVNTTAANLYTHKWAFAAWNQAFRHGQTDVAVRGALQSARLEDLQRYRDLHFVLLSRVVLCVIGGVAPETLKPAMEEKLGGITSAAATLPAASVKTEQPKALSATWDINVTHYIETYKIPAPRREDYPALYLAAMLLNQSFFMDQKTKQWTGAIMCGTDLTTPEGRYLYVSASIKPGADVEKVKLQIERQLDKLKQASSNPQVPMMAVNFSMQMSAPTDIAMALRYKPAHLTKAMMMGNIGLQWGLLEFQYGDALPKLARAMSKVSASDVASVAKRYLAKARRSALILVPKT